MRTALLLSLLCLAACASPGRYSQAVGPLVEPMVEPAPSFPHPGYTPNGAGLPGERVPGQQGASVPRSPNTRILPADPHPGLWAADGAPRASAGPRLFEVDVPFPSDAYGTVAEVETEWCTSTIAGAASATLRAKVDAFPPAVRACMAARALLHCAEDQQRRMEEVKRRGKKVTGPRFDPLAPGRAEALVKHARALATNNCAGVHLTPEQTGSLVAILSRWTDTYKDYQ